MKPILEINKLSKKFRIGQELQPYLSLRESITSVFKGRNKGNSPNGIKKDPQDKDFWALRDVNFDVYPGDSLAIIGRNGAGKTTLLKILSKITPPTQGKIICRGRVASLLEVGTGFHPELTGNENIFLNGSILGLTKREIKEKFDEIVDFSGVEKFLDTPLKRYSSGMQLRLAFSVAAHLEPEILMIDEVLAVGDAEFQKKCIGKMKEEVGQGRTILFVSHNMDSLSRLCNNAILLDEGKIIYSGACDDVINYYLRSNLISKSIQKWDHDITKAPGNDIARLISVKVHTKEGNVAENFDITKPIGITMEYEVLKKGHKFTHGYNLYSEQGINILNSHDVVSELRNHPRDKGTYSSTMWIPENFLAEGIVSAGVAIFQLTPFMKYFHELDAVSFSVSDKIRGNSARGDYVGNWPGVVRPLLKWDTIKLNEK